MLTLWRLYIPTSIEDHSESEFPCAPQSLQSQHDEIPEKISLPNALSLLHKQDSLILEALYYETESKPRGMPQVTALSVNLVRITTNNNDEKLLLSLIMNGCDYNLC